MKQRIETMPTTISGSELSAKFNEISTLCHRIKEPVFITKNGHDDLALMSIDLYEYLIGKLELYQLLGEARISIVNGHKLPLEEAFSKLKQRNKERQYE